MKLPKDLVAASAVPLVLATLAEGEDYGYALIRRIRVLSDGELTWTEGMLYPVLHRLEEQGYILSRWDAPDGGRRRKYYRLTDAGQQMLREQKEQWGIVQETLGKLWGASNA